MCSLPSAYGPSVVSRSPCWRRTTVAALAVQHLEGIVSQGDGFAQQYQQWHWAMPPQQMFGMLGPGGGLGRALAVQHLAEVPQVCGSVPPIDNLGPFATEARRHFVPDPLRSIANDHYRAQNG